MTPERAPGAEPSPDARRAGALVEGEFPLTAEDFRRIAAMLHADAGISLHEHKATLVYSRLAKRLRALGLRSFRDYCALVADDAGADERQRMLAALTTNVTRFFREPHHFDHLKAAVLPPLLAAAKRGGRVRIWSAACSSGPEPYSIGLVILGLMPDAADHDVRVLATDIDPVMVAEARAGRYPASALQPAPADLVRRFFKPERPGSDALTAGPELRKLIAFNELNLIGQWPMKGRFDAIFCRNVVIYFEEETQSRVWNRFTPLLNPGGRLYIGHSERLTGAAVQAYAPDGVTIHRLKGAGA